MTVSIATGGRLEGTILVYLQFLGSVDPYSVATHERRLDQGVAAWCRAHKVELLRPIELGDEDLRLVGRWEFRTDRLLAEGEVGSLVEAIDRATRPYDVVLSIFPAAGSGKPGPAVGDRYG